MRNDLPMVLVACLLCGGCAVVPIVTYKQITSPDVTGLLKFTLANSVIVIDQATDDKKQVIQDQYTVKSVPGEDISGTTYGLASADSPWSQTNLTLATKDGTTLVETLATDTQDNRVKIINAVGGVVTTLISAGVIAAGPGTPKFPLYVDMSDYYPNANGQSVATREAFELKNLDIGNGLKATIDVGKVPSDAVDLAKFPFADKQSVFFYSACRSATVVITSVAGGKLPAATVSIADPNYVQTIALPFKGKITMQTQCGYSSTVDSSSQPSSATDILTALANQVKSIRGAKKSSATPPPAAK